MDDRVIENDPGGVPGSNPSTSREEWTNKVPKDILAPTPPEEKSKSAVSKKIACVYELPVVRAYLDRIDAQCHSMFKAAISDNSGKYPKSIATITFARDGSISVSTRDKELDNINPTDDEAENIRQAIVGADWLQIKPLDRMWWPPSQKDDLVAEMKEAQRKDKVGEPPVHFWEFRDAANQIVMVQIRGQAANGDKYYKNVTYWEDDQWRVAEPDRLPLFNAHKLAATSTLFIHEGAKAAAFCQWMVDGKSPEARQALADHPWGHELSNAAHVGWVGGAKAPGRTDWDALRRAGIKNAYIVTDNDEPGEKAAQPISRALSSWDIQVHWVWFDEKFPASFDLADKMPPNPPSFRDCVFPATWATKPVFVPKRAGAGRPPGPKYELRDIFASQWMVLSAENDSLFINVEDRQRKLIEKQFNSRMRSFSDVTNTADLLKQDPTRAIDGLAYRPGPGHVVVNEGGQKVLNTWSGPKIKGNPHADVKPWTEYLNHLIPVDEDRHEVCKWIATLIARPDVRMKYGMILLSKTQGTGKSTLLNVLSRILGKWNVSTPNEHDVVVSPNNGWLAHKTLVFVNEIYSSGSVYKAYRKLKEMISDETIRVNEKYIPGYQLEARAHFILCSNEMTAIPVEDGDRRFLVPKVAERLRPKEEWDAFYEWIDGDGPAVIVKWAEDFVAQHGFVGAGDRAPTTDRKKKLIEDSRSAVHVALRNLAEAALQKDADTGRLVVLIENEVAAWIKTQDPNNRLALHMIREELVAGGMFETARLKISGQRRTCLVSREHEADIGATVAKECRLAPDDLFPPEM